MREVQCSRGVGRQSLGDGCVEARKSDWRRVRVRSVVAAPRTDGQPASIHADGQRVELAVTVLHLRRVGDQVIAAVVADESLEARQ